MQDQEKVELLAAWVGVTTSNLYDMYGKPSGLTEHARGELHAFLEIDNIDAKRLRLQAEATITGDKNELAFEDEDAFLRAFQCASRCIFDFLYA